MCDHKGFKVDTSLCSNVFFRSSPPSWECYLEGYSLRCYDSGNNRIDR